MSTTPDIATVRDDIQARFDAASVSDEQHDSVYWSELQRFILTNNDYDSQCALIALNEMKGDRAGNEAIRKSLQKTLDNLSRFEIAISDMPNRTASNRRAQYSIRITNSILMAKELMTYVTNSTQRIVAALASKCVKNKSDTVISSSVPGRQDITIGNVTAEDVEWAKYHNIAAWAGARPHCTILNCGYCLRH